MNRVKQLTSANVQLGSSFTSLSKRSTEQAPTESGHAVDELRRSCEEITDLLALQSTMRQHEGAARGTQALSHAKAVEQTLMLEEDLELLKADIGRWERAKFWWHYSLITFLFLLHVALTVVLEVTDTDSDYTLSDGAYVFAGFKISTVRYEVIGIVLVVLPWSFAFGAAVVRCALREEMDELCDKVRHAICIEWRKPVNSCNLDNVVPRPMSAQWRNAQTANRKQTDPIEAVRCALEVAEPLCTAERVLIAAEAATLAKLRQWDAMLSQGREHVQKHTVLPAEIWEPFAEEIWGGSWRDKCQTHQDLCGSKTIEATKCIIQDLISEAALSIALQHGAQVAADHKATSVRAILLCCNELCVQQGQQIDVAVRSARLVQSFMHKHYIKAPAAAALSRMRVAVAEAAAVQAKAQLRSDQVSAAQSETPSFNWRTMHLMNSITEDPRRSVSIDTSTNAAVSSFCLQVALVHFQSSTPG